MLMNVFRMHAIVTEIVQIALELIHAPAIQAGTELVAMQMLTNVLCTIPALMEGLAKTIQDLTVVPVLQTGKA